MYDSSPDQQVLSLLRPGNDIPNPLPLSEDSITWDSFRRDPLDTRLDSKAHS